MVILTGDTHGRTQYIRKLCYDYKLTEEDIIVILGDAGYNFTLDDRDRFCKAKLAKQRPTILCIQGNHECRPEHIKSYKTKEWHGGTVWYEPEYPNLLFARDGDVFELAEKQCLVIGGAYSVDKYYRLMHGSPWWEDEQPTDEIKKRTENAVKTRNIDVVLSHTCPLKFEPVDAFLPHIDQSSVDKSTEIWLDKIDDMLPNVQWYCGHYHIIRVMDKIHFLFNNAIILDDYK